MGIYNLTDNCIQSDIESFREGVEIRLKALFPEKFLFVRVDPFIVETLVDSDYRMTSSWTGIITVQLREDSPPYTFTHTCLRLQDVTRKLGDSVEKLMKDLKRNP